MSEIKLKNKTVKELDEIKLVGFRVLCPGDQYIVEIPKASLRLSERIGEIKQVTNPLQQYGAFTVKTECANEDGYWVGVEVNEYEDIPTGMVSLTVPSQKYAVIRHTGPNDKIVESYNELHKWIDENKFVRLKNKWHLEKFYNWTDPSNVDVELFDTISK
ncbi:GyrI-like domain-containing protein [Bacillus sp. JJ1122]|uniref:GyrI-like domain-containing protein n=1 Tax=Bacillus sp. JJ1122 TaxID=3122951 RepID=UPI002FFD8F45